MNKIADLHIHTNASDGDYSPKDAVIAAQKIGFSAIAITDHDTIDGINEAQKYGSQLGLEVISAIELSTIYKSQEIHILGYYINTKNNGLLKLLEKIKSSREERIKKIIIALNKLGFDISFTEVLKYSSEGVLGRPHVAKIMQEKGYVSSIKEAFNNFLNPKCPAFVPRFKILPMEAISIIKDAGGIPVLAHPGLELEDELVLEFCRTELMGIEVWHPEHNKEMVEKYLNIAKKNNLLITGGSDWHGNNKDEKFKLGSIKLDYKYVIELKKRKGVD